MNPQRECITLDRTPCAGSAATICEPLNAWRPRRRGSLTRCPATSRWQASYIWRFRMRVSIHVGRDPRDTAFSCFSILFARGHEFSYDLSELGRYFLAYQRLIDHWRDVMPETMLDVHYERVVADFEPQARRIIAHCGLEWDDACLTFHRTVRSVRTASATQVRRPIYHTSIGRWRPYEDELQPLLQTLG